MGKTFLRVVLIRTKKKIIESGDNHPYHYYAIVTNMSNAEMTNEKIIQFYRKRAQVENNIKDLKNGMDFHHFPCQSLKANHVWGLIGIIAYNLMRLASFTISKNGCFAKTVRKKIVMKAGEINKHARSIEIRMMDYVAREVQRLKMVLCGLYFEIAKGSRWSLAPLSNWAIVQFFEIRILICQFC
jgi:transposase